MNASNFSLEFRLSKDEVQKLNKMYFKNLYKGRVRILFGFVRSELCQWSLRISLGYLRHT